ncbi:MAG TPA: hypothetical protein P5568_08610 [Acidobacteriota bacterium]|nr:hypothetical protein [Acidobacteriota bacterium]
MAPPESADPGTQDVVGTGRRLRAVSEPDRRSSRRAFFLGALLLAALYVPFLDQAYHIDDRIYLEVARNILERPLFPYDFPAAFEGMTAPDAASHSHLPLISYYLAPWTAWFGEEHEWLLHLVFLPFPMLAAWGLFQLARPWTQRSEFAPALLLTAPAFVVSAHTLMTDVPFLAFWTAAVAAAVRLRDGRGGRWDPWILLGSLLGAAFLSLLAGGLWLLLVVLPVILPGRNRLGRRWLWILLTPLLLWFLWYLLAYFHYDRLVLLNLARHVADREAFDLALLGTKALSFVLNLGAVFLFPAVLWWGLRGPFRTRIALLILLLSAVPFFLVPTSGRWEGVHIALFCVFLASGFLVVWEFVCLAFSRQPEDRFLTLWFFGIFAAALFVFYAGSARYVLAALPPVILAWMRRAEALSAGRRRRSAVLWTTLLLTALNGAALAVADYRFAAVYPRYASKLLRFYKDPAYTVWYTGEWGFRYYMEKEGARMLLRADPSPRPGDILVKPYLALPWVTLVDGDRYSRLLEQVKVEEPFPLRILDFSSHAGFYSTAWGLLPYSISTGRPWEWFNVFEITKAYDGPAPEQPKYF